MDKIKIADFKRDYPNDDFPRHKTLSARRTENIRENIICRLELPSDVSSLELVKAIAARSSVVPNVNAENERLDLGNLLRDLGITPRVNVLINWYRFDDIDELSLLDVSKYLLDLWYPAADAIDIFDESLEWIISIDYSGGISFLRFSKQSKESM